MMRTLKTAAAFALLALAAMSCSRNTVIDESVSIPKAQWNSQNWAYFTADIQDTVSAYSFFLTLRHLENYKYCNLYIFLHTTMPNGAVTHDTVECTLAEPSGRWIGKGTGSMRNIDIPLNPNLLFPMRGQYRFEVEQAMWDTVLEGISDVGIRIKKHESMR